MKFAKELDESAVPEWREKYLDYKQAKKKLKSVGRAVRNAGKSPLGSSNAGGFGAAITSVANSSLRDGPVYAFLHRGAESGNSAAYSPRSRSAAPSPGSRLRVVPASGLRPPLGTVDERSPLNGHSFGGSADVAVDGANDTGSSGGRPSMRRYGSIIGSPPSGQSPAMEVLDRQRTQASLLELPDPALDPARKKEEQDRALGAGNGEKTGREETEEATRGEDMQEGDGEDPEYDRPISPGSPDIPARPPPTQLAHQGDAYRIRPPIDRAPTHARSALRYSLPAPRRANSNPDARGPAFIRRLTSFAGTSRSGTFRADQNHDVALEAYRELDFRQAEFFLFLDRSLAKIETFYREKEDEATERLRVLREQLHMLRNQRAIEIDMAERRRQRHQHEQRQEQQQQQHQQSSSNGQAPSPSRFAIDATEIDRSTSRTTAISANTEHHDDTRHPSVTHRLRNSVVSSMDNALGKVRPGHVGKTSRAMRELGTPSFRLDPGSETLSDAAAPAANVQANPQSDYVRRPPPQTVPYRQAKRKLKAALVEYYRGLELLKSYALLNRTAFRKINKKYDKTVRLGPDGSGSGGSMRYMAEKINPAHFTNSDTVDMHIQAVEDLYARYFERGNHKIAVGKLRAKGLKIGQYSGSMFRTGFFAAAGFVLALLGLINGLNTDLNNANPVVRTWASYLLQIYAGYFLLLLLVVIFCIDARVFMKAKVNYVFIFEFNTRDNLDWRQLSEMPAFFGFLLGLIMYLNFQWVGGYDMYVYWPVVLIGLSVAVLFLPAPIFYPKSRLWFLYSMQRLLFAGAYPVEFRDFFLGDMFCSLTYAMGNIELFFCLYAYHWNNPPQCNSSNSRVFGFLQTLPAIWRALQCVRRYADSRYIYPHLANFGKYGFTILSYTSLSLFRIERTYQNLSLFIVFSSINSVYCIFWDIVNDWSLGSFYAKHTFLRNKLTYKYYWYYLAILIDAVIRCNWIFYVIYKDDIQHSTIVSFAISFTEVLRRGMWTLFRVENEHSSNVGRFRASRDIPLPYKIRRAGDESEEEDEDGTTLPPSTMIATQQVGDEESGSRQSRVELRPTATTTTTTAEPTPTAAASSRPPLLPSPSQRRWQDTIAQSPVVQALKRAGNTLMSAHAQDYQRKKESEGGKELPPDSDEDEDDEDDGQSSDEEEAERVEAFTRGKGGENEPPRRS